MKKILENLYGFFWESMTANNCNTYLLTGERKILIDPGHRHLFDHVETGLHRLQLERSDIDLVLSTHAHPDHIEAVLNFNHEPAQTAFHEREWQFVESLEPMLKQAFGTDKEAVRPDILLKEGDLNVGDFRFRVYHTPGHSPGSICIYWPEAKVLFTGDLIFSEGVGRTDLPGGNGKELKNSILRLADLPIEWILPGHGEPVEGAENVRKTFDHLQTFWFRYL